jgi:hypothetical protein
MTQSLPKRDIKSPGGFAWINNYIMKWYGPELGPYGIAVYMALALHSNNQTQVAFPSNKTVAKITGMSTRQVQKETHKLERLGLILVHRTTAPGRKSPGVLNRYTLLAPPTSSEIGTNNIHTLTDTYEPNSQGGYEPGSHPRMNAVHVTHEQDSPKQDTETRIINNTQDTTRVPVIDIELPEYFENLLRELGITTPKVKHELQKLFQVDKERIVTWAIVLNSEYYCERHNIRSPSGFFLKVVRDKTPSPALQLSSSMDACQYCGNTGRIVLANGSKQEDLRLACCPICGILPRTSKWDIAIF